MLEFDIACEAIGKYGSSKGPSEYQLCVPLLKQAHAKVNEYLEKQKKAWDEHGCNILIDDGLTGCTVV